jgi:phosphoadenosine phosphosulfate reductase
MEKKKTLEDFQNIAESSNTATALRQFASLFPGEIAFSTSLGAEDQVITDLIFENDLPIRIFTLDTGRLFEETNFLLEEMFKRYGKRIEVFHPQTAAVEKLVSEKGPSSFYLSIENRKECCRIRKVEPLGRALKGVKLWVTGIRSEQAESRKGLTFMEWDESHQLHKFHPLLNWKESEVWKTIHAKKIPYNALHDKGFPSIGCAPCTRAIASNEDPRAGRWWWERPEDKECGIHIQDGKVVRVPKAKGKADLFSN